MLKHQISNYLQLDFLFLTDLHDHFTLIETRLTAFFRINPKHCLENWGQETSTCSSCENSLDFMLRTWLTTKIKMLIIKGKGSDWIRLTGVGSFLLNDQRLEARTQRGDVTQVKTITLDLESPELSADLLQAVDDILHHDVLQGEEAEPWPVSEDPGVEVSRIVTAEKHCLQVRTTVGYN